MERFLGQTLDLANYVLIMILSDCLYKISKICNTLNKFMFQFYNIHFFGNCSVFYHVLRKP